MIRRIVATLAMTAALLAPTAAHADEPAPTTPPITVQDLIDLLNNGSANPTLEELLAGMTPNANGCFDTHRELAVMHGTLLAAETDRNSYFRIAGDYATRIGTLQQESARQTARIQRQSNTILNLRAKLRALRSAK